MIGDNVRAKDQPCPRCGAKAGQPCRMASGDPYLDDSYFHRARLRLVRPKRVKGAP